MPLRSSQCRLSRILHTIEGCGENIKERLSVIEQMKIFAKVVHHKNMSMAAKELDLSTASVSRQIAGLEEKMGVQLLDRSSRKIMPTKAGEQFLAKSKLILESIEELKNDLTSSNTNPEGLL